MGGDIPNWFSGLRSDVISAVKNGNDHLGEAVLGVRRMIDEGNTSEARRLADQIRSDMALHLYTNTIGETKSSQLQAMLNDDQYFSIDPNLCQQLKKASSKAKF